jgi:RimJ/RimL family protein N-acetyltransferase
VSHPTDDRSALSTLPVDALVLHTSRLLLVAATPAILRAELAGPSALAEALGVVPPPTWPPDLLERDDVERMLAVAEAPGAQAGWNSWYLVERATAERSPQLVGIAGFGAPPGDAHMVMIGYSVVPEAHRRGYATEATRALVAFALARPDVAVIHAETFPTLVASVRVLEKVGFRRVDGGSEPGVIRFAYP